MRLNNQLSDCLTKVIANWNITTANGASGVGTDASLYTINEYLSANVGSKADMIIGTMRARKHSKDGFYITWL